MPSMRDDKPIDPSAVPGVRLWYSLELHAYHLKAWKAGEILGMR